MRVLFLTDRDCVPQNGGIERVVATLSDGFSKNNIECYLLSSERILMQDQKQFKRKYLLEKENVLGQLETIVKENDINIIFSHYMSKYNRRMVLSQITSLKKVVPNVKHVALYHSQPGVELVRIPLSVFSRRIIHGVQIKVSLITLAKQLLLRLVGKNVFKRFISHKCRILYDSADKLVMLNEKYIPMFNNLVDESCVDKYCAIGNPLPFDDVPSVDLEKKDKVLLVVSRMEDGQKKLSKVLCFWKEVEPRCLDWKLEIVGDGPDKIVYESMSRSMDLRRVAFRGIQNPRPYYERSSLFLMTSDIEGFPMTLLEAMQFGCVPIVFNSFASASTIVSHSVDGILVPPCDDASYVNSMIRLMTDDSMRNRMAYAAMHDCQKFSVEKIIRKWIELFNDLKTEKNA